MKGISGADTLSKVVHQGAERRPGKRERSALVNNLAAGESPAGSRRFAPTLHGRSGAVPTRTSLGPPVAAGASGANRVSWDWQRSAERIEFAGPNGW